MSPTPTALACPAAAPDGGVQVEVVAAGELESDWSQVVNTGRTGKVTLPLLVGIVRHPRSLMLVDAGVGQTTRDHRWPVWPLSMLPIHVPTWTTVNERVGMPTRVLMTHLHYDHVGGLFDLPHVDTWTTPEDYDAAVPGMPPRLRDSVNWRVLDLQHSPKRALGRPAIDVMGDDLVKWIWTPGHTPGSAAVLVRATDKAWLFVGDTAWVDDHLATARRPGGVAFLVDAERPELDESLTWARWLKSNCPDLEIVAGHEPRWATEVK